VEGSYNGPHPIVLITAFTLLYFIGALFTVSPVSIPAKPWRRNTEISWRGVATRIFGLQLGSGRTVLM
jgi:hypothetical protein